MTAQRRVPVAKSMFLVRPDISAVRAAQIVLIKPKLIRIVVIGSGGTGSWIAPLVVRTAKVITEDTRRVSVVFVDHDYVEEGNIPRQNFCDADIGQPKSLVLAARYGPVWGVDVGAVVDRFDASRIIDAGLASDALTICIGCVDNAKARLAISRVLKANETDELPRFWWLDIGNMEHCLQVLVGSSPTADGLGNAFPNPTICHALPSPLLQHPELRKPLPDELGPKKMSCAEMALANIQSLMVNPMAAAMGSDMLGRMLIPRHGLKRFATYYDLKTGSAKIRACTPEEVAAVARRPVDYIYQRRAS
jgi:PRTRC genetic system ThiF family protein